MRFVIVLVCLLSATAWAAPSAEDQWLTGLTDRVIADLAAGKPLVTEVHVPLCDNSLINCGNAKLGDGDKLDGNLYWSTTPGFGVWFDRKGGGWKRVARQRTTGDADILQIDVYRRTVTSPASWVARGAPAKFELDVVIHAWRGKAIDRALAAYAADISATGKPCTVTLDDGTKIAACAGARLVAWVGHNRLMDLDSYTWPASGKSTQGNIFIACHTARYMEESVVGPTRVPLLMTRDFLFSNAAPLEATVLAFVGGGDYAQMRNVAVAAYATIQKETIARMNGIFTNPADRRWKKHRRAAGSARLPRRRSPARCHVA